MRPATETPGRPSRSDPEDGTPGGSGPRLLTSGARRAGILRVVSEAVVETERLRLRPWRPAEDLLALAALNADAEVMRWVAPNRPLRPDESAALLRRIVDHWREHGYGLWAVEPRAGGDCIGFAGLAIPSFLPAVLPAVEVGWRLAPAWWGRGLATEAAEASVAYGFETLGLRSVVSIIDPGTRARCGSPRSSGCARARTACTRSPGAGCG